MLYKRLYFASIFVCIIFASPAKAADQCEALSDAASHNDTNTVSALIASGVDVNCSYTGSYVEKKTGKTVTFISTPLNEAAYWGMMETVPLLLSHGANVNLKDGYGRTPLHNADDGIEDCWWEGGTDEECKSVDEVYRLLEQVGGVYQ